MDEVEVVVRRSARRRRTVGARLVDGRLEVTVPAWMTAAEERVAVEDMKRRARKWIARDRAAIDLPARARALAAKHDLPAPASIDWSDRMNHRWGSCTVREGRIRIASQVAAFPEWVLDAVIVHELAHLRVPNHSARFWELANRYPLMERARGYLIAKSGPDATGQQPGSSDDVDEGADDVLTSADDERAEAVEALSLGSGW